VQRAEPISALYEQGRVRHVGSFVELEDDMAAMKGDGYAGSGSPDRVDALVWGLSELMITPEPEYHGFIAIGLGAILGHGEEKDLSVEENYKEAEEAAGRGELNGAQLRWFLAERARRNSRG
jgi:hypothetical protein